MTHPSVPLSEEERKRVITEKIAVPKKGADTCAMVNASLHHHAVSLYILRGNRHSPVKSIIPSHTGGIEVGLEDGSTLRTSWDEPFLFYLAGDRDGGGGESRGGDINAQETLADLYIPDLSKLDTQKMKAT